MRSLSLPLSFAGALVLVAGLSSSCGDDDKDPPPPASTGGSGGGGAIGPVACGSKICEPIVVGFGVPPVAACCADRAASLCGLDTSLLTVLGARPTRSCEPVQQAGTLDSACPDVNDLMLGSFTVSFKGCCRAETRQCGYLVDRVSVLSVGLGCVDSGPFLEGGASLPCGTRAYTTSE